MPLEQPRWERGSLALDRPTRRFYHETRRFGKAIQMKQSSDDGTKSAEHATHSVRLPSFLVSQPVGLGTVVKRVTKSIGVRPCGGCEQRAAQLDKWLSFSPPGRSPNL